MVFTKDTFIETILSLKEQFDYDKERAQALTDIYGVDVTLSDNSRLTNRIFALLHKQFPPNDDVCMIQTFCYDMDFGRSVGFTIEKLWNNLTNNLEVVYEVVSSDANGLSFVEKIKPIQDQMNHVNNKIQQLRSKPDYPSKEDAISHLISIIKHYEDLLKNMTNG